MVLSLVVLAMLSACAPPTPEKVVETVVVTREVPVEVTLPPKVTISLAYNEYILKSFTEGVPAPFENIKALVKAKYPEIELDLIVMPCEVGPMHDMYAIWFTAEDSTVDIMGIAGIWTAELGKAGWIKPLNDLMTPEMKESLLDALLDVHTYEGKRLGIPFWGGTGCLFYRSDLLEEYGFDPPETYDDLVTIAEKILPDHPELSGYTWPAMKDQVLVNGWVEYLTGFGGTFFDEEGKCAVNSPEGVAALEYTANLIKSGISPEEVTSWKEEDARLRFLSGKAIFHRGRISMARYLLPDGPGSAIWDKWGVIPNPAQPGGKHTGFYEGWAYGISAFSDNPEEAWKVLETIAGYGVQKGYALAHGPCQPHKDTYTDPDVLEAHPYMEFMEPILQSAAPPIPTLHYAEMSVILQEELHSAITGIKTPKKALDDACARIDEVTAE